MLFCEPCRKNQIGQKFPNEVNIMLEINLTQIVAAFGTETVILCQDIE